MEEVLIKLQEAMEIKSAIAKQEAVFWQKTSEALSGYLRQQQMPKEKISATAAPHRPAPVNTYMTNKQAAEYLGIADGTLNKWRVTGGGPKFAKIGGSVRYKVDELEAFANKSTFPHTSAYGRDS